MLTGLYWCCFLEQATFTNGRGPGAHTPWGMAQFHLRGTSPPPGLAVWLIPRNIYQANKISSVKLCESRQLFGGKRQMDTIQLC